MSDCLSEHIQISVTHMKFLYLYITIVYAHDHTLHLRTSSLNLDLQNIASRVMHGTLSSQHYPTYFTLTEKPANLGFESRQGAGHL